MSRFVTVEIEQALHPAIELLGRWAGRNYARAVAKHKKLLDSGCRDTEVDRAARQAVLARARQSCAEWEAVKNLASVLAVALPVGQLPLFAGGEESEDVEAAPDAPVGEDSDPGDSEPLREEEAGGGDGEPAPGEAQGWGGAGGAADLSGEPDDERPDPGAPVGAGGEDGYAAGGVGGSDPDGEGFRGPGDRGEACL